MNFFIIDVETSLPQRTKGPGIEFSPVGRHYSLIRVLSKLKDTALCVDGGRYRQELASAQIHVVTTWSLERLESWLDNNKAASDFIGVVQRNERLVEYGY